MDATPAPTGPTMRSKVLRALASGVALVLFVAYCVYSGSGSGDDVYWFSEALQGTLSSSDVDQIASGFVTNHDVRLVTPEGTRTHAPGETAALQAEVHALLDPLVGRDSRGLRLHVDGDDGAEVQADFGDTRVMLTLLPTDTGHAISTLEVGPRRR